MINGNMEKVSMGKKFVFVTPKGDTIVYQVDDIIKEMIKAQPEKKDSNINAVAKDTNKIKVKDQIKVEQLEVLKEEELKDKVEKPDTIQKSGKEIQEVPEVVETPKKEVDSLAIERLKEEARQKAKLKSSEVPAVVEENVVIKDSALIENNTPSTTAEKALEEKDGEEIVVKKRVFEKELYPSGKEKYPVEKEIKISVVPEVKESEKVEDKVVIVEEKKTEMKEPEKIEDKFTVAEEKKSEVKEPEKVEDKVTVTKEKKLEVKEPERVEKKVAVGVVVAEEKKPEVKQKNKYEYKKYYLTDREINVDNLAQQDTLKFIKTELSVYKDFPNIQFGENSNLSFCYDILVRSYHGYDEEVAAKYTTRFRVCQVGKWNEKEKSAEVFMDTPAGRKKVYYSIAMLDETNLVLVKR